eukprot:SAG22_NODE_3984_length_1437_cov_1.175635_3_plen_133_part_01
MLLTLVVTALAAQAAPLPPGNNAAGSTAAAAAEQVGRAAQQLRGDANVAAALRSVNVDIDKYYAYFEDSDSTKAGAKDKPRPAAPADRENPAPAGDVTKPAAEQALAAHGFATALDLRLLAGGPEAAELITEL